MQPSSNPVSDSLPNNSNRSYRLWLFCICAGMLVYFTQVTALFPVLPLYVTQRWHNAPVGFVVGALAAGLLFFRPPIGWLIDRWGRKPVLLTGLGIMLAILPLYLWSPNPFWLMGVRVLHGISQAAFATASQTMLIDLVPPVRRTAMLGYLAMCNTIGYSLGPLLGSLVFAQAGFIAVVFLLAGSILVSFALSLPLPWLKVSRSKQSIEKQSENSFPWKVIVRFPVRDATLLFSIGSFLHGGVVTFLPLFVSNSALFYSLNALVAVLVRFGLGRWGNRVSQRWVVSIAIFCSGTALIGLSIAPNLLIVWSLVYGLGFGSLFPVLSAIVSLAAPTAVRGRVYSIFLAGFDSGMTLGGAGVQPLVQMLPLSTLFLILGGIGWAVSLIAFRQFAQPIVVSQATEGK
ncbi:MFS transporter [Planktothrix sp. FACHB-1355]|uniref:MFS transporter n=2 Tax=Oscillatoriophycideae TaxID=1301283 RepID=A0A926VGU4_9CYAN|nr:MFS transporter [Aerosakkonema funiforme]MBD2182384.1 MFS transporter [Aerosakkonema funiforme FACHB-1375]MBD3559521.1 MFS transporter [Planktothrix sp. FACHB-1355]